MAKVTKPKKTPVRRKPPQDKYLSVNTAAATLAVYSLLRDGQVQPAGQDQHAAATHFFLREGSVGRSLMSILAGGAPIGEFRERLGPIFEVRLKEASHVISLAFIYQKAMSVDDAEGIVSLVYLACRLVTYGLAIPKGTGAVELWKTTWSIAEARDAVRRRVQELQDKDRGKAYKASQFNLRMWKVETQHTARQNFYQFKKRLQRKSSQAESIFKAVVGLLDALPSAGKH